MRSLWAGRLAGSALTVVVAALPAQSRSTDRAQSRADTVVRALQPPVHPGVATLSEEMSIGVADGPEHYMLGQVNDVALAKDNSLYVFDHQVPIIRHYDESGKFLRNIGRSGSGPGEYRSVSGIATTPDGRLLVWDTGNWRINVYAPDGDFITQWVTPSGMSGGGTAQYSRALHVDTSGTVVARKTIFDMRNIGNRPTVWLRFRADGTPLDTLHEPAPPRDIPKLTARAGNVSQSAGLPFAPQWLVTLSPLGHLIAGFPDRYAFEILQRGGPVIRARRDATPEPVSRTERAEARQRVEERMRGTDPNWSWNGPDIPATKPLYHTIHVGLDGRIWIGLTAESSPGLSMLGGSGVGQSNRRTQAAADREPPRASLFDVFEPDGRYLGQVQVPAGVSAVVRRADQVWAMAVGDDDVPRLKRYRIAWRR